MAVRRNNSFESTASMNLRGFLRFEGLSFALFGVPHHTAYPTQPGKCRCVATSENPLLIKVTIQDLRPGPASRTCLRNLPSGPAFWSCPQDMPPGPASRTCLQDLPPGPASRTCRQDLAVDSSGQWPALLAGAALHCGAQAPERNSPTGSVNSH